MSYQWEPVFVCALCRKAQSSPRWQDFPFGWKALPRGWAGSTRKNGECYCEDCWEAVNRIKGEMETA